MVTRSSARSALRAATAPFHDRVDAVFSKADLKTRAGYARFLAAQAAAHIPVEDALDRAGAARLIPDWTARRRADLLRADLAELGLATPVPAGDIAFADDAAVLGGAYVLEGSRLGGTLLHRSVGPDLPTRFLGGGDSAAWRALLTVLDSRLSTPKIVAVATGAACDVFLLFEASGQRMVGAEF